MSHFHIIYNSSEHPRNGGVGFGVRTATEGTPDALIDALEQNGVFNFDTSQPAIGMNALITNPEKILDVPKTYFYLTVKVSPEQTAHVIGRKVAVGFDYVYYKNFGSGRLGNYVVDCHVWTDEVPIEAFDLFFEQPAEGSIRFVPASPVPSPDNAEMARLSLDKMDELPATTPVIKASKVQAISPQAFNILFALINARNNARPLLIKEYDNVQCVLAQMMRLLDPADRALASFMTNYQEEGKKKGLAIIEINRHYPFELFERQFEIYDPSTNIDNTERRTFGAEIERAMIAGDIKRVHRLTHWILSESYHAVKDKSKATNDNVYNYVVEPERFDYDLVATNAELRSVLAAQFKAQPDSQKLIDTHVQHCLANASTVGNALKAIDYAMRLQPDIALDHILNGQRAHLTQVTLGSAKAFGQLCQAVKNHLDPLAPYIDLEQLRRHPEYLQQFDSKDWCALHERFLTPAQDDLKGLLKFTMVFDKLQADDRTTVLKRIEPNGGKILDLCCALACDPGERAIEPRVRDYIYHALNTLSKGYDCYRHLEAKRDNPDYTGLFVEQLFFRSQQSPTYVDLKDITDHLCALPQPRVGEIIAMRHGDLPTSLLNQLKALLRDKSAKVDDKTVAQDVVQPMLEKLEGQNKALLCQWGTLHSVLTNTIDPDELNQPQDLTAVENIALEINRNAYVKRLLPLSLPVHAGEARKWVDRLLEHQVATPDELIGACQSLDVKSRDNYWHAIFANERKLNVQRSIMRLAKYGELTISEAEDFMSRHFPDAYRLSKQQSVIEKTVGFFKGMFKK